MLSPPEGVGRSRPSEDVDNSQITRARDFRRRARNIFCRVPDLTHPVIQGEVHLRRCRPHMHGTAHIGGEGGVCPGVGLGRSTPKARWAAHVYRKLLKFTLSSHGAALGGSGAAAVGKPRDYDAEQSYLSHSHISDLDHSEPQRRQIAPLLVGPRLPCLQEMHGVTSYPAVM